MLGLELVEVELHLADVIHDRLPGQHRPHLVLQSAHAVVVGGQEDEPVLLLPRLLTASLQNFLGPFRCQALPGAAERGVGWQHNQPKLPVVWHITTRGENVDAAEQSSGHALLHALADGREDILLVLEAALALFHLAAQVWPCVEPEAVVGTVQVVKSVTEPPQRVLVQADLLAGLNHA